MRERGAASDGDPGLPPLAAACQGMVLLALEGLSLGLALAEVALWPRLPAYVGRNEIAPGARVALLVAMAAGAALFSARGAWLLRRDPSARGAYAVRALARRLAPLALAALAPLLCATWLWIGRDLAFLALASLWALAGQAALRVSLSESPAAGAAPARAARALPGRAWTALVCLGAVGYAAYFAAVTVINHRALRTTSFDLGIFDNLMWNLVHGGPFLKASPALGPVGSHFGRHATLGAYAFAPLYALAPRPETLLVLQAVLIGAGAIPLFLFARRHVGDASAAVVAAAYLLYPPLHGANLYDFHFLSTAPVFVWATLYLLESGRDRLGALVAALTLALREDVAAGLVVVGAYLCLTGRRPRAGLVLAAVALVYTAAIKLALMPMAGGGDRDMLLLMYRGLVPPGATSFAGVLATVAGNPGHAVSTLLERDKLVYLLQILAPLAFLPLLRPIGLLLLAPGAVFTLLATGYAPLVQISFQYTAHWTAAVFVAAVLSLAAVARPRFAGDGSGAVRRRAWLGAMIAATLVCSHQYGAVPQRDTARGGFARYQFGASDADRERRAALHELIALVPPRASIVATERLVPQVSGRPDAYTLRVGVFDAEYALFPVDPALLIAAAERPRLTDLLERGEFGIVAVREPFALARRGHPPGDNAAVLERLAAR